MKKYLSTALVVSMACMLLCAGCTSHPRLKVSTLSSDDSLRKHASEVWSIEKPAELTEPDRRRAAIVDFAIEYATHEGADLGAGLKLALPTVLYHSFVESMRELGSDPIALSQVTQSAAYEKLEGVHYAAAHLAADTFERQGPAQSAQSRNIRRQIHELLAELNSAP